MKDKQLSNLNTKTILVCIPAAFKIVNPINYTEVKSFKKGISVQKLVQEHKGFCDTMVSAGVVLKHLTPLPHCPQQTFVRDLGFMLNDTMCIGKTNESLRVREHEALEQYLKGYRKIYKFKNFLEGGDVVVFNKIIFVGISGRTTMEAAEELKNLVKDNYKVVPIKIKKRVLHLDTVFNVINDIIVYYPSGLKKGFNPHEYTPKVVEVSKEEQKFLATNFVAVSENIIISNSNSVELNKALQRLGIRVVEHNFKEMLKLGGSYRCCSLESPI